MNPILKLALVFVAVALLPKSRGMDPMHQKLLDKENEHRSHHHAAALEYNEELSSKSQEYAEYMAEQCKPLKKVGHSPKSSRTFEGGTPGENIYSATNRPLDSAPRAADSWYEEIENYPWGTDYDGRNKSLHVGHFTQQVWVESKKVGYGIAQKDGCDSYYVVARYFPRGNMHGSGSYKENVRPSK